MSVTTSVPPPAFTPTGFIAPEESAILAGIQKDWNLAFRTILNFGTVSGSTTNPTPQGQLTASEAAILGYVNDTFLFYTQQVDPSYAVGRMQDAIARIYFIWRNPALPTVLQIQCVGLANVVIPVNALIQDTAGNTYTCTDGGTIPLGGSITLTFANLAVGPIAVPATNNVSIYQSIPGWDTVTCLSGVLGNLVESPSQFEARRAASVAHNSAGSLPSVLGAVLTVPDVLDAYATENVNGYEIAVGPAAAVVGAISGSTLTVSSVVSGTIAIGQTVCGTNNTGIGVAIATTITGGSGSSWTVSPAQTVASTTLNLGGVLLAQNSLYVAVVGGEAQAVAQAIWSKKAPGCGYNGNTSAIVQDTSPGYSPPYPSYSILWQTPAALQILFAVNLINNPGIPSNATALVQSAIIAAFAGLDGGPKARIGTTLLASRFYSAVAALGSWAQIFSLEIGSNNTPGATFTASISASTMTVSAVASGTIAIGQTISDISGNIIAGTTITAGSGSSWTVSAAQTVGSEAMVSAVPNLFSVPVAINQVPEITMANIAVSTL